MRSISSRGKSSPTSDVRARKAEGMEAGTESGFHAFFFSMEKWQAKMAANVARWVHGRCLKVWDCTATVAT
jgi:hypothetical protein